MANLCSEAYRPTVYETGMSMDRQTESSTAKKLIQWELVKLSFDEKIGMKFPGSIVSLNLDMVKMNSKVSYVF